MASEDIFENYSEEIVSELEHDNTNRILDGHAVEEETEDTTEEVNSTEEVSETIDMGNHCANSENDKTTKPTTQVNERETKIIQIPLTRIRNLMKLDPDLHIASHEAAFVVTRATELFIESLARESYIYTAQAKKKTVQKRDVDMAIAAVDSLMFLEGAMNF